LDNITHGLLGIAIGALRRRDGGPEHDAPLSHTDKAVAWATFLAAEVPDSDVFFTAASRDPMAEYRYHRGLTHTLLFAPVAALMVTLLTRLIWREAKVKTVYGWSLASVLIAHLLNDWMTGWGTRLLYPFSDARLGLDWVPIVDLLYTLPLLAAVLLAWRRPQTRRKAAMAVVTYLGLYTFGYRAITHTLVQNAVTRQYAGQPVARIQVSPDMLNPLSWQFTVDLGDRFEQGSALPFARITADRTTPKIPNDPVVLAVRNSPELKPFFDQFGFVDIQYKKVNDGYEATLGDVRYRFGGRGMTYLVRMNTDLLVTEVKGGGF
jgi:inner membrane protein